MRMGVENTAGQVDYREQIEYAVEEEEPVLKDVASSNKDGKLFYNRLRGTNPWPDQIQPTLRPAILNFVPHVCHVAHGLRQALCLALGLNQHALDSLFDATNENDGHDRRHEEPPHWVLKLVSYPTLEEPWMSDPETKLNNATDQGENTSTTASQSRCPVVLGVGSHTDTNFLTLIQQEQPRLARSKQANGAIGRGAGLQVFSQGQWRDIEFPPRSPKDNQQDEDNLYEDPSSHYLICNLGEQAQVWSRNYFLATPHRVLLENGDTEQQVPTEEPAFTASTQTLAMEKNETVPSSRISLPLFYNPRLSATIVPIDFSAISNPPVWERSEQEHSWKRHGVPDVQLTSVGENTFKSLARSHPIVFAKHHPDLELLENGQIVVKKE